MIMNVDQIAVIGAGTMGAGIASVVSLHNEVVLIDVSVEQLQKATANVEKTLANGSKRASSLQRPPPPPAPA